MCKTNTRGDDEQTRGKEKKHEQDVRDAHDPRLGFAPVPSREETNESGRTVRFSAILAIARGLIAARRACTEIRLRHRPNWSETLPDEDGHCQLRRYSAQVFDLILTVPWRPMSAQSRILKDADRGAGRKARAVPEV